MAMMDADRRVIDGLFEAAIDGAPWSRALADLAAATRAQVGSMIAVDRKDGRGTGFCIGVEDHWAQSFVARESRHVSIGAHFVKTGQVFTDRMVVPRRQFERTSFFNEWARPSGQTDYAGVAVVNAGEEFAFVGLSRGPKLGAFDDTELKHLALLGPHLRRATQIWMKLGAARTHDMPLEAAFDRLVHAVLLTDASGRIRFANRAAHELLALGDALLCTSDGLAALAHRETAGLRALIAAAADADTTAATRPLRVSRGEGRAPLTVLAVPLRTSAALPSRKAQVLVLVVDPERPFGAHAQQLRLVHGLSPTEAALVCHLVKGAGLKAAARALNIAPTTARTHLKRVFAKTGARNQVQLAELATAELLLRP